MKRFQLGCALLGLGWAFSAGTLPQHEPQSNEQVEAAAAALMGLVEADLVPAPARLQVLRLPRDPELPPYPAYGDGVLSGEVLSRLGGNVRGEQPSLATCEEVQEPMVGARCRFPNGVPVGLQVQALSADQGVVLVAVLSVTTELDAPLTMVGYRVAVDRESSGEWRFGEILSEESAQVNWRKFSTIGLTSQ